MSAPIPRNLPLVRARDLKTPPGGSYSGLELKGRLVHFGGTGSTTCAAILTARMHAEHLPVAWISATADTPYPPDLAANGVDLDGMIFVFAEDALRASRAAEHLLRAGTFGLVVIDLEYGAEIPDAVQGRLLRLARRTDATLLCITREDDTLHGSMISLRARISRRPVSGNRYQVRMTVTRDKHGGPRARSGEVCYAPAGMH